MLTTAGLGVVGSGDVWLAVVLIVLSNLFYAYGESLTAAFLPELARSDALGRVSGWGWSFGYFGGMLTLGLSLAYVLSAQKAGQTATQFVPVTMWITAVVYGAASVRHVHAAEGAGAAAAGRCAGQGLAASLMRLRQTWQDARSYVDFVWLMVVRLLLPGRRRGGDRAGGGLRRAGAGLQARSTP